MPAGRDSHQRGAERKDRTLHGDQRRQRRALRVVRAPAGQPDDHESGRGDRDADPLSPSEAEAEEALGEHGEEDEPAGEDCLHDRQWGKRERAEVKTPGHDRHHPADQEPSRAEQADGAAQRMANQDRRGEHRAALFEQEGEIGGRRRADREDQPGKHDKGALLRSIGGGSLSIGVALTEQRGFIFMRLFLISAHTRCR